MQIKCPNCSSLLSFTRGEFDVEVACPGCGSPLLVEGERKPNTPNDPAGFHHPVKESTAADGVLLSLRAIEASSAKTAENLQQIRNLIAALMVFFLAAAIILAILSK